MTADSKIFLVKKPLGKASSKTSEQDIRDRWIVDSQGIMYGAEQKDAKDCLMRDIEKYPHYWFRSGELDELVPKFVLKVVREMMQEEPQGSFCVEISPSDLELLKQGLRLKINIWHGGHDEQTEALLKKLESL